ncbi:Uncharacterized membrane protein YhaH, DUF805 family [Microlunatus sagamiharensis]|uniref:Uncharacterized membrane protein YhaH, DUF805 family n=1 Tax=Microlunatus sagamiharensis TaxID=546874 RepID=A0A1H2N6J9_9ACTN|nr:DUF805 domain-containing protein [Microlunatus sagamiharensis]SDV00715.1 Uncharacterized membrane protein YhaH, DUF805 family [Microlunatus sagamiharensis]
MEFSGRGPSWEDRLLKLGQTGTIDGRGARDQPVYGASSWQAAELFWTRYVTFSGRASRSEFWWWMILAALVAVVLEVVRFVAVGGSIALWWADYSSPSYFSPTSLPGTLWALATFVPSLALNARRLHDTNRSGGWQLIVLVPVVGWVWLLVLCAQRSDPRGERYDRAFTVSPAT